MEPLNLEPRYSTSQVPGKCIKCLAEQQPNNCLLELLKGDDDNNKELEQRFVMLYTSKDLLEEVENRRVRVP